MLLDSSGSMTVPAEKWRLARLLAGDIVAHASASSQLALVTFSGEIRGIEGFSVGRSALLNKIRKIDDPQPQAARRGSPTPSRKPWTSYPLLNRASLFV